MVEKWLLQVEKQMIKSLRDTIEKAIAGYYATELTSWVLDWPGQVRIFKGIMPPPHKKMKIYRVSQKSVSGISFGKTSP